MQAKSETAERLRELREERGLTQVYVAKKLGFENSQRYANYEYGSNQMSLETAKKVADVFGVKLEEFFYPKTKQNV